MTYAVIALGALLLVTWHLGFKAGQASRRERSATALIRDQIGAFRAMGHDDETAKRLCREAGAAGMRKAGVWEP